MPARAGSAPALAGLAIGLVGLLGLLGLGACSGPGAEPGPEQSAPAYAFMNVQADGKTPVSYSSCRPIPIRVDPADAPPGYLELYRTAIRHTAEATGLRFRDLSAPGARPVRGVPPVTVRWASAVEVADFGGDQVGFGGSNVLEDGSGVSRYVSGQVVLDADAFDRITDRGDTTTAQGIIDHEFGHLVGLDHVDDPSELMNAEYVGQRGFGPGDLAGLAALGTAVPC